MTNKVWVESPSWRDLDIGDRVLYVASSKAPNKTNSEFVVAHAFYDAIEQQPVLEDEDGKRLFYDGYYGNHGTLYVQREFATENTTD